MSSVKHLFEEYYNPLCNYASKILNNDMDAEEVVQSLFIQLWENNKLSEIEDPERFLLRSTKFKCIDFIRKDKSKKETLENEFVDHDYESELDIQEEDIEPLLLFFASKLPPKTREVFLLSRKSKLSNKEIAEEQCISIKTVENHMGKALKDMRKLLKTHDFFKLLILLDLFN